MNRLLALLLLLCALPVFGAQSREPADLELSGYHYFAPLPVYLNDDDKRWLKQKKTIVVAVYPSGLSPLMQDTLSGRYRGMNADYLALIERSLQTRVAIVKYPDESAAIAALRAGSVDTVLTGLIPVSQNYDGLTLSVPLVRAWPNLVTKLTNVMDPLHSAESLRFARVNHFPDDGFIRAAFPNAEIIDFTGYQPALTSVANGQNTFFIGDSLTTGAWLSQEFSLELSTVKYWPGPQKVSVFLFSPAQNRLKLLIDNTLNTIDDNVHTQIAQSVLDKGNLSFLVEPLDLTLREKQWLEKNQTLRAIVNPWFAPYTMVDSNQETRGVVGDIFNLLSLQTGLKFETTTVRSNSEMIDEMKKGGWHIVQAATYDLDRDNSVAYTHPFITTSFVTVVRKETQEDPLQQAGSTVAISADHSLLASLMRKHPTVHWRQVENSGVAINLVATGKVDAAVSNQLTARYLSEHYYPDQLTWHPLTNEAPALISFAVPRAEPELLSILNKALDEIPQKEVSQIVSKWIRLPDVKIDTWELYNRPFYLLTALASLLVVSTLLWAIFLVGQVRKRKRSQMLLEQERNRAENANREKREFLARMSHEIRTPVSAIVGFLELLQRSSSRFSAEDQASVEHSAQASRSLLKLIGEILDLEKIESGLQDIAPQWTDTDALVSGKLAQFSALAKLKSLHLSYNSSLDPDRSLLVDAQLLGQVLTNIVSNAVKFTPRGTVHITSAMDENTLVLTIEDSGSGISQDDQGRLFNAFSQGEAGEHVVGSGLGLAISRALMTRMGGTITLESALDQGTKVTLRLPTESSQQTPVAQPEALPPAAAPNSSLRILIADDHPTSRQLLRRQLATLGVQAQEAHDGRDALRMLNDEHFDLLITDLNMPVMNGIQLARAARKTNQRIVICGLTATAQEHERQRCLAAGMNECLFKPVSLSQLSLLLAEISPQPGIAFSTERLALLAQGNRPLMLKALQEAQQENHRDFELARKALGNAAMDTVSYHLHRIHGTAQLLGATALSHLSEELEEKLRHEREPEAFMDDFQRLEALLNELDGVIRAFVP
ncbi:response regulator [Enterobacteriaceae bacterium 89]|nr:response regulator [Enterobacteriaceae bacterium 89]